MVTSEPGLKGAKELPGHREGTSRERPEGERGQPFEAGVRGAQAGRRTRGPAAPDGESEVSAGF